MALDIGGEHDRAADAYRWLAGRQRPDGSWAAEYRDGCESAPAAESNHAGYLAVGGWHSWLLTGDEQLVTDLWPAVRRGLDLVVRMQLAGGAVSWALRPDGTPDDTALLTGNAASSRRCAAASRWPALHGEPSPTGSWRSPTSVRPAHPARRLRRPQPLLDGLVLPGARRRAHGDGGARAAGRATGTGSSSRAWARAASPTSPWVTGAETCELALALAAAGQPDAAIEQVAAMQHLRHDDGSYWTGLVYADDARWPVERTTWTAAAVVLAADALAGATAAASLFTDPAALPAPGLAGAPESDAADPVLP